jgi:hypothetical protein
MAVGRPDLLTLGRSLRAALAVARGDIEHKAGFSAVAEGCGKKVEGCVV